MLHGRRRGPVLDCRVPCGWIVGPWARTVESLELGADGCYVRKVLMDADEDEKERAAHMEMASAIFSGSSPLQMVVWRSFVARHEATLLDELTRLEAALRKFIDLRERGLAEGGLQSATVDDVEGVRRLGALVSEWFAGGDPSPEIEPLARRLFAVLGGDARALPPEDPGP